MNRVSGDVNAGTVRTTMVETACDITATLRPPSARARGFREKWGWYRLRRSRMFRRRARLTWRQIGDICRGGVLLCARRETGLEEC